jgi:regulator of protease activity HflC (stomatin/prohibitin superfamily)
LVRNVAANAREVIAVMVLVRRYKIAQWERGFLFKDREFVKTLRPGAHWVFDPLRKTRVEVLSVRNVWVETPNLDVLAKAGAFGTEAQVLNLGDSERALVWVDGRFSAALKPGLYALWTVFHEVRIERVEGVAREPRFTHETLAAILSTPGTAQALETVAVEAGHAGLYFKDGRFVSTLEPGTHAFWKNAGRVRVVDVDLKEQVADIAGQEIMTSDKVTLRINAVVTFRVADPLKAVMAVEDFRQALYREAQLALRAVIGTRELDALLSEKDRVADELLGIVKGKAVSLGVEVSGLGIRDVILPGEMKDLLNKVTEAKKAAEAALITRREETAAMRSQSNTARIFEGNPTLMRLKELETLEKIADKAKLSVVLGEKGLAEKVVKLI